GRSNKLCHLFRTRESIVEDDLRFHSDLLRQSLQVRTIVVTLTPQNMRVGRAGHDVHGIVVPRENMRHGLNDVFDPFVRREQTERKKYGLSFHAKTIFIKIWIQEW